ncbi:GntR family transcriptional regulator [Clostridioides difficile]|nr:GntR family transcriptional regulator [Clostridioides difficile]
MAKNKFSEIYEVLKEEILDGKYTSNMMLPTELQLIERFSCSRNTVRRAISQLNTEGYVQSIKGKGVVVLENSCSNDFFLNMHNFKCVESIVEDKKVNTATSVLHFSKILIDNKLSKKTGFKVGSEVYYLHRLRYIDNIPKILDINYFLCSIVKDLDVSIAQGSIYKYIEECLGTKIVSSRKIFKIEKATELELKTLPLNDYNCVGVIKNSVYTDDGKLFEYTESKHTPETFVFMDVTQRY